MKVIKSRRKSIVIEITERAEILVRAPLGMSDRQIQEFVASKRDWMEDALRRMQEKRKEYADAEPIRAEEIRRLAEEALAVLPEKVADYAEKIGVTYGRITVRNQKTRWGSCSSKGNLNFNCLLMLTPEEVQDYVVVHELCHRKEMNHSRKFWREVEKILPDYKKSRKWLKENGNMLIQRMLMS